MSCLITSHQEHCGHENTSGDKRWGEMDALVLPALGKRLDYPKEGLSACWESTAAGRAGATGAVLANVCANYPNHWAQLWNTWSVLVFEQAGEGREGGGRKKLTWKSSFIFYIAFYVLNEFHLELDWVLNIRQNVSWHTVIIWKSVLSKLFVKSNNFCANFLKIVYILWELEKLFLLETLKKKFTSVFGAPKSVIMDYLLMLHTTKCSFVHIY